ncbi:hypothetical protein [Kitasatospora sp. NPDC097691]|uniref:hypothetical protein n=1 Tax=Kitasatospora sp. NPDC097691 TaxID=3157231 RepID=UPI0033171F89
MEMFTGAYPDNLEPEGDPARNRSMQDALDTFMNGLSGADRTALERTGLTVVALTGADLLPWAGHRHNEVHYSASVVKLLAMYAAHTLRFLAEELRAEQPPATSADFYAALATEFNSKIRAVTPPKILAKYPNPADENKILPDYQTVLEPQFDATGTAISVDFTFGYRNQLRGMLINQTDPPAGECIHGVAFGFMNAKAGDDGFFDAANQRGIWLAGDYVNQWTPVTTASVNDGATAQATTAVDMARLFARMFSGTLESGDLTDLIPMLTPGGRSWFHQLLLWPNGNLSATHSKIGFGPLKPDGSGVINQVVSEALIAHDSSGDLDFAVVWQNLKTSGNPTRPDVEPVARMVEATINAFSP